MGKRITSLQEITTVTDNDFIPVDNQSSGARKLSAGFLNDIEDALDGKQDALTAGANINIAQDGTISATDTTYTAGTNVDITNGVISATDTDTDALSELTDTAISSPSDGDALVYDSTSGKWVNGDVASDIGDLNDVDITSPSNGQVLSYNSTSQEWENTTPSAGSSVSVTQVQSSGTKIATVTVDNVDTDLYAPTPTEVVANPSGTGSTDLTKIDVGGTIYNIPTGGSGSSTLAGLTDVDLDTPTDGQGLVYDATNQKWVNGNVGGGSDGTGYEEEQIYLATSTSFSNITVDWDWNNYDAYVFRSWDAITSNQSGDSTFLTKQQVLDAISNNVPQYFTNSYGYASYNISASTLTTVNHSNSMFMQEIVGIKFGSGSGGSGSRFTMEELWSGNETASTSGTNITLTKNWTDYDAISFEITNTSPYYSYPMILTKDIKVNQRTIQIGYNSFAAVITFLTDTTAKIEAATSGQSTIYKKIYGIKFGGGGGTGDLSAMELTQNQYNNLPTTQKLDDKELYFINNNITTEEVMDVTDFVNKVESGGAMTITADATNNTLTYVWGGAATIGANSFYPTVIPSNVTRIDYKITTGTSYTTSDDQFKIGIGVKTTYDAANWAKPTDNNWVTIDTYNTQNTVIEGSLDLSEVDEDTYLYICGHGWNMTIKDLTIVTVNESTDPTKIMYKDVEYGNGGGSSGGGNLYGTTDPTNDLGNNGDIYMKYQGGSEPVESDYETVWSGTATVTSWGSPYTFPFDVTEYHKLRIGNNEKLVSELKTYSYLIDHQAEDEWWIIRDFPAAELCLSDADPTKLQLYGQSGYSYTVSEIQGTTMELQPPQILNVYGKVEDEWVGFPGYSETVLWSGSESISQNASPFSVPNSSYDDISEYDEIQIEYENGNNTAAKRYSVPVEMFKTYPNESVNPEGRDAVGVQRSCYPEYSTADNCIKVYCESNYPIYIKKIIGVKHGESSANSSASLYKWYTSNDGTITVRTGSDGVYWFFNGFNTDGGGNTFVNIPSELAQFAPTNTEPQLSEAYSDPSGSTVGWIGFYVNTIRGWNPAKSANLFTTLYGVVKADGANEQHNGYYNAYTGIPNSGGISYSTAEQVVGTWIDGKPLYQKTVEYTVVDQGASGGFDITSDFPATYTVRNCVCEFEYDYQGTHYSLTNAPTHYFNRAGNASTIKFSMGSGTISGDLTVTIQYTKTI